MVFIKINRNPPDSHKRLFNILPKPYLLNLILIVIIVSTFCNSITAATDNQKFAVYHFRNLTGEDEWQWLERGFSDMLNHAFSQSDKINYIPTEEI